jgi:hypothetical protein
MNPGRREHPANQTEKGYIMKKLLAVLALSALAACGGDDEAAQDGATTETTTTETVAPVTDPAATMPPATTMPMDSTGAAAGTMGAGVVDSAGGNTTPEGAETTTP